MKNKKKLSVFISFIFVILLLGGCGLLPEEQVREAPTLIEPPEPRINVVEVERGDIRTEISGLARVSSLEVKPLYFTQSGRVNDVFVSYGDQVQTGDILARLDIGDLEFQYEMARLDMKKMELERERLNNMVGRDISPFDKQIREIDFQKQEMQFERLEKRVEDATLYAPFTGQIIALSMREGNRVEEYSTVVTVADPENIGIQLNVSAHNLRRLVPGLKAEVQLEGNIWANAVVTTVPAPGSELAPGEPDRRVWMELENPEKISEERDIPVDELIQKGQLIRSYIILEEREDTLLLPKSAIRSYSDRTFVRIKDGDYRREVDIKTGLESDTRIEILEGLEEGQQIITR